MTSLEETLRTLRKRGMVSRYFVAEIPTEPLQTGWINENLRLYSKKSDIDDSGFQSSVVIPTDRLVRLLADDQIHESFPGAVFMFAGTRVHDVRLVSLVREDSDAEQDRRLALGMSIRKWDLNALTIALLSGRDEADDLEVHLDYLEQMRADHLDGRLQGFLSLHSPPKSGSVKKWMKEGTKNRIDAEGNFRFLEVLAPLITRWLMGLQVFKGTTSPIAALFLLGAEDTVLCLWDGPAEIETFAAVQTENLDWCITHYVSPLMCSLQRDAEMSDTSPKVTISAPGEQSKSIRSSRGTESTSVAKEVAALSARLNAIPLEALLKRLSAIENRSGFSDGGNQPSDPAAVQIVHRFNETNKRLEELTTRLKKLEERLSQLEKNVG